MARASPTYTGPDPITVEVMLEVIKRLHLEPGDILVIDPAEVDILAIAEMRLPLSFPIPILAAPAGSVHSCTRKELLDVLAALPKETEDG